MFFPCFHLCAGMFSQGLSLQFAQSRIEVFVVSVKSLRTWGSPPPGGPELVSYSRGRDLCPPCPPLPVGLPFWKVFHGCPAPEFLPKYFRCHALRAAGGSLGRPAALERRGLSR